MLVSFFIFKSCLSPEIPGDPNAVLRAVDRPPYLFCFCFLTQGVRRAGLNLTQDQLQ